MHEGKKNQLKRSGRRPGPIAGSTNGMFFDADNNLWVALLQPARLVEEGLWIKP
ncbi:MAG: hypothetical protein ACI81L_001679 [Verrucomicrobiales bacterium]|jgi:hypothetical protein